MGDVGETFKAYKGFNDARKQSNREKFELALKDMNIPFRDAGNNTFLIRENGIKIDVYASKNKLKFKGKMIQSDLNGCLFFIKKKIG